MTFVTKRRESGSYEVFRDGIVVGQLVRKGPNSPSSEWVAMAEGWEQHGLQKKAVKDALMARLVAQNGHAAFENAIAYAGSDVPEPHVPVPKPPLGQLKIMTAEEVTRAYTNVYPIDPDDDDFGKGEPDDRERFTYLGWHEVNDRMALLCGLILDMVTDWEFYNLPPHREALLRNIERGLTSGRRAMQRIDEGRE